MVVAGDPFKSHSQGFGAQECCTSKGWIHGQNQPEARSDVKNICKAAKSGKVGGIGSRRGATSGRAAAIDCPQN